MPKKMPDKISLKPDVDLFPLPVVLVGCGNMSGGINIITISWIGVICSSPPMIGISVRPQRHSHRLLMETDGWTVNIPTEYQLYETDFCGTRSGKSIDKFSALNLTPIPSRYITAPMIKECPVSMECLKRNTLSLGSHDMFLGEVVALYAVPDVITDNEIDAGKVRPMTYNIWDYWNMGNNIGSFGKCSDKKDEYGFFC